MARQGTGSPTEAAASAAAGGASLTLSSLPEDVLLQVWKHVEEPQAWASVSTRLRALSERVDWRSRWFIQRYYMEDVIFQAISRPNIFTAELYKELVRLGAPSSRALVQLLHVCRDLISRGHLKAGPSTRSWGSISHSAYAAIIAHSAALYGDKVSYGLSELDSCVYMAWVKERQESSGSKTTGLGDKVQDLFRNFAFSPLPLALSYDHGTITITERASVEELALLRKSKSSLNVTAATANDGCVLSEDEVESRIIHIVRCFDQDLHIPSCKSLKIHGVVKISRQFARTCISAVTNPLAYRNGQSELEQEWGSVYTILVHLDRKHTLPFRLSEIIEEVLLPEQDGAVTPRMLFFVERLQHDFPNLPCVNALFGPAMFLKAERQHIQHIDEIKQLMGNYQVTTQDIMAVCLRNHCRTVTSIQYGLRHVKGFDLSHFMAELIQKLLNQPYRGIMLRELDRFFAQRVGLIDFRSMLVLAVEKQAFTHAQIPPQQWHLDRSSGSQACNPIAPLRSMLAFNWTSGNAPAVNLCACDKDSASSQDGCTDASLLLEFCDHQLEHATHGTRSPWVPGFTRFGGLISMGTPDTDRATEHRLDRRLNERLNNIHGPFHPGDLHIVPVIAKILGPHSCASNICLSHALVNGNVSLVDELLALGVDLTLYHFKAALKVGYYLPESLLHRIMSGAPFRSHHDAAWKAEAPTVPSYVDPTPLAEWIKIDSFEQHPEIVVEAEGVLPGAKVLRALPPRTAPLDEVAYMTHEHSKCASSNNKPALDLETARLEHLQGWRSWLKDCQWEVDVASACIRAAWPWGRCLSDAANSLDNFIKVIHMRCQSLSGRSTVHVNSRADAEPPAKRHKASNNASTSSVSQLSFGHASSGWIDLSSSSSSIVPAWTSNAYDARLTTPELEQPFCNPSPLPSSMASSPAWYK